MFNVLPATLILAERGAPVKLSPSMKLIVALPAPDAVARVSQLTFVAASHAQSLVVLRVREAPAPVAGSNRFDGEIAKEHAGGDGDNVRRSTVPPWPTT